MIRRMNKSHLVGVTGFGEYSRHRNSITEGSKLERSKATSELEVTRAKPLTSVPVPPEHLSW